MYQSKRSKPEIAMMPGTTMFFAGIALCAVVIGVIIYKSSQNKDGVSLPNHRKIQPWRNEFMANCDELKNQGTANAAKFSVSMNAVKDKPAYCQCNFDSSNKVHYTEYMEACHTSGGAFYRPLIKRGDTFTDMQLCYVKRYPDFGSEGEKFDSPGEKLCNPDLNLFLSTTADGKYTCEKVDKFQHKWNNAYQKTVDTDNNNSNMYCYIFDYNQTEHGENIEGDSAAACTSDRPNPACGQTKLYALANTFRNSTCMPKSGDTANKGEYKKECDSLLGVFNDADMSCHHAGLDD